MNWVLIIANTARKDIKRMEKRDQVRVLRALSGMEKDPFAGDRALLTDSDEEYRLRVGSWRIFYKFDYNNRAIYVIHVRRRDSKTYRRR